VRPRAAVVPLALVGAAMAAAAGALTMADGSALQMPAAALAGLLALGAVVAWARRRRSPRG
jgi:hypothetical protein